MGLELIPGFSGFSNLHVFFAFRGIHKSGIIDYSSAPLQVMMA
jgi:hypothetical protein